MNAVVLLLVGLSQIAGEPPPLPPPIPLFQTRDNSGPFFTASYLRQRGNGYQVGAGWRFNDDSTATILWQQDPKGTRELLLTHRGIMYETEITRSTRILGLSFQLGGGSRPFRCGPHFGIAGEWYLGNAFTARLEGSASLFLLRKSLRPTFEVDPSLIVEIIWCPVEGVVIRLGYDLLRRRAIVGSSLQW